ncbi:uncharacterized protein LOC128159091 isoform X1 [Crassostrea angulata]|uniref:uncharacterized protein LOC128159091 isoform X1 n=1 Tax=Magallana angulata TaxID=2784310 RepID=UPI0022B0F3C2|nr:uncharacterized protein LOC128159091 isoform X1 [Crassostrea angulata]
MVVAQPIGDKDTGAKNGNILNSVSQNQNRQKSVDQRKDRRSKSHPHVRVRQKLRHWTGGEGEEGQIGSCSPVDTIPRLPVLRPESDDVIRRRRVLRKFSTSISISKRFWSRLSEDQTDGNRMEQWAKLRTSVSLGTVISRAFGDIEEKRRLVINPIKVKQEIRKKQLYSLFRFVGRLTITFSRLAKAHSLRFREDDDDISPYIKGLTFHDYDNQPDLMFDKSQYKAKKSIRVPEETKRILCKPPSQRTEQELYSALLTLRNIEAFAAYPNRMQKMIVAVGQYERFEAKRIVVRQGHPGSSYYFMLSGAAVVMVMDNPNSYARPIKHLEKGMDFGEIALTLNIRRQGTIITKEPCELMSIGRRDYQRIFMAGGVRSINDPDQEKFLRSLPFLRNWPIQLLEGAGDKTHFLFFKSGATIVKETSLSPWLVIVKSGSISILKKLKRVLPFEWKRKKEIKFVPEKEKRDNYNKRLVLRRHILTELKIPLKGNTVDDEDNQFEDYPGKYRIFIHPGEEPETVTSETITPLADRLPDIKENNAKTNSFQNIQKKLLPRLSEDTEGEVDTGDNPLFSNLDSEEKHPVFSLEREETSFDILAPLPKKKAHEKNGNRRESVMEREREMMGFEEKTRTVQDDLDNIAKDPDEYTLADLDPEFVRVQTLIKGQVFGLSDLILEQKTNFSIVSNGADVILIDQQFYLKHAPEKLISKMRQELCPYPTDDDLQTRLQQTIDWDAYRTDTMSNTLQFLQTRRQLRHSLKV